MGSGVSLSAMSSEDIAETVRGFGSAFEQYADTIVENGLDGGTLATFNEASEILDDLDISKAIHKKRFEKEFARMKATAGSTATDESGGGGGDEETPGAAWGEASEKAPEQTAWLNELITIQKAIIPKKNTNRDIDKIFNGFISYRVASDAHMADSLYINIKALVADMIFGVAGQKPKIFYDRKSIESGMSWEDAFVNGLVNSLVVIPIVTYEVGTDDDGNETFSGALHNLMSLGENTAGDRVDNVLLEWELSLILLEQPEPLLQSIFPIFHGGQDERGFLSLPWNQLSQLPRTISPATKKKVLQICKQHNLSVSDAALNRTVADTVQEIMKHQGADLSKLGSSLIAIEESGRRVFLVAANAMLEVGLAVASTTGTRSEKDLHAHATAVEVTQAEVVEPVRVVEPVKPPRIKHSDYPRVIGAGPRPDQAKALPWFESMNRGTPNAWTTKYPVHYACMRGDLTEILELIYDRGFDVNQTMGTDWYHSTPVQWASSFNQVHIVKALVALGADVHARNAAGNTCFDDAKREKSKHVIEFLNGIKH